MKPEEIQLIQKKRQLLKILENHYDSWDHSSESAIDLLKKNEEVLNEMEEIDHQLSSESQQEFKEKYKTTLNEILQLHKEMIQVIQEEREKLNNQLSQISKKKKVVDDYIPKEESMFVDRDI